MADKDETGSEREPNSEGPDDISTSGWHDILLRVKSRIGEDHLSIFAAGVAFFGLLALFPALAATISIAALAMEPAMIEARLGNLLASLPPGAADILQTQLGEVAANAGAGMSLAAIGGLLLTLYSASKGIKVLIEGINLAYHEAESRGLIRLNLLAIGMTLGMIVGLIVVFILMIAVPALLGSIGLSVVAQTLLAYGRWIVLAALALFGLAVLYRYGPARSAPGWRWVSPGSIAATVLWLAGSAGFSFYVDNFGSYNETFGALGGVIVLLTWLWLSAFIVLLGAELNSEIEAQTARRDS